MKYKVRRLFLLLTAILVLGVLPLAAFANSPGPTFGVSFILSDLPQGTVYVDLLIPLPDSDPMYTDLVEENLSENITPQSEIVSYCSDEYRSYTFHYQNAKSKIEVEGYKYVHYFTGDGWENLVNHREDVYSRGKIRLAMLDKDGSILKVSPTFELRTEGFFTKMIGTFDYNARTDEFTVREETSLIAWIVYISLCALCLLLTVVTEELIAVCFRLKGFRGIIRRTNIVSQILMHTAYVLLYALFSHNYLLNTLILEVLVYTGELLYYRHVMWGIPAKKCFAYTVTANTASLIIGVLLLGFLPF